MPEETQTETKQAVPEFVSKLSLKKMGCNPMKYISDDAAVSTPIARVWGMAQAIKTGEDKLTGRAWVALTGQFGALNIATNVQFRTAVLFLPDGIQDIIENEVRKLPDSGSDGVMFAMDVNARKADNPAGYSWTARNIRNVETVDPLAKMLSEITTGTQPAQIAASEKLTEENAVKPATPAKKK